MSNFDPNKHPRGNPNNDGQFAAKDHDEADTTLNAGVLIRPASVDDIETFSASEISQDNDGPISSVEVRLVERENGAGGELELSIEPVAHLNLTGLGPAGMTERQWAHKLDEHYPAVVNFLETRYSASINVPISDDLPAWADIEARFYVQIPNRAITQAEAFDIAWNQTKAVQLYNESDHGTYGTENLGRLLNEAMDAAVILPHPYDVVRTAETVNGRDIDTEVELRAGEREIRDVTAVAIAKRLSNDNPNLTELHRLGRHGWGNRQVIHDELLAVYQAGAMPRDKRQANMMFTWLIHGGDNG